MEAYDLEAKCCWQDERFHVELPELPTEIHVRTPDPRGGNRVHSARVWRYVPERTAKRVRVPYQSHVALGHYECGECGKTVGVVDKYCRHCGSKLEEGWK